MTEEREKDFERYVREYARYYANGNKEEALKHKLVQEVKKEYEKGNPI